MSDLTILAAAGALGQNAQKLDMIPADAENYAMEAKYDGWRLLAHVRDDGVALFSRTGKRYDRQLPQITAELSKRFPAGTWLDGEAVALTFEDGRVTNDWGVAQSAMTKDGSPLAAKVTYIVFDLLAHRDIDARTLPYEKRRAFLEQAMEPVRPPVQLSLTCDATQGNHDKLVAMGFEGTMLKRLSAPYASGHRGRGWGKLKARGSEDVVIMGFETGKDVGTIIFGQWRDGELVERGRCKRKTFVPADPALVGSVIEVEFSAVMKSGALRHPRLLRQRDDKLATQCVWA